MLCAGNALGEERDPLLLHEKDGVRVRAHLQAGINPVGEQDLFWGLADIFAPQAQYNPVKVWLEGYVKPGISFERQFTPNRVFYGKVSGVVSGTLGTDAYDVGDTGRDEGDYVEVGGTGGTVHCVSVVAATVTALLRAQARQLRAEPVEHRD